MKVLHVIPSVAARYGGPSRAVVEMCTALSKRGVKTLIATTDADGEGKLAVELGTTTSYQGVPTVFFSRQWSEAFKYSHPLATWLDEHVSEFDVVHIHAVFSHSSLAAASACRKHAVPYIVRPLGTLDPWSLNQKSFRKKLFWYAGVRQMLDRASSIHYTAEAEQLLAEQGLGLTRGAVIPIGINIEASSNGANGSHSQVGESTPYVLVLSRLHHKKGLELLIRAFLSLTKHQQFHQWKLILAGDGDVNYVRSLKELVSNEKGSDQVTFPGWLDGARKDSVLRKASLLALTSYQENFGICVVEALACSVPVLISPHVNLAEEIEATGTGWIADVNVDAIRVALAEALGSKSERTRRGEAGRKLAAKFAWPIVSEKLLALYSSVCDAR